MKTMTASPTITQISTILDISNISPPQNCSFEFLVSPSGCPGTKRLVTPNLNRTLETTAPSFLPHSSSHSDPGQSAPVRYAPGTPRRLRSSQELLDFPRRTRDGFQPREYRNHAVDSTAEPHNCGFHSKESTASGSRAS